MGTVRGSFDIMREDTYGNRVLGGIIEGAIDRIRALGCNSVTVHVANKIWYGSFTIPNAVGFSTPLHLLHGGSVILCYDERLPADAFIALFARWKMTYDAVCITRPERELFTADRKTCSICLADYALGERIFAVTPCNHIYHYDCISQWILRHCDLCKQGASRPQLDIASMKRELASAMSSGDDKRGADILRAMCTPSMAGNTSIEAHWRHQAFGHGVGSFPCPMCGAKD